MKQTKISYRSNLMWEGSRMMLPEHVEAIKKHQKELEKKSKPDFDEQYLNELARLIAEAKKNQYIVRVAIFHEYDNISINGQIVSIDQQSQRIRIDEEIGEPCWVYFDDILSIDMND